MGVDVAWEMARFRGGLTERSSLAVTGEKGGVMVLRVSGIVDGVSDLVDGSLKEEEREVGALRRWAPVTETADRWPWKRLLMEGKWRLNRDVKVSEVITPDLRRLAIGSPGSWPSLK